VGDTLDQFLIGLSGIAQRLDLPADRPPVEILGAIHRGLEESSDWLWVIDNASDPALIAREYLPKLDSGRILITTTRREPELRSIGAMTVELTSFFDHAAGARFLAGLLREGGTIEDLNEDDRRAAEEISEEVSGLPLALDQAAAYIEHTGSSPRSYLAEYRRRGPILRNTRTPLEEEDRDHPAVTRTFSMLFDWVKVQNEASADLLRLCAFLSADAIPEELLALGAPELGSPLGPAVEESLPMTQMPALRARLVEVNPDSKTIRVHRVVQDVIQDLMDQPDRDRWAERAVRAVNRAVPEVEGFEPEHFDRYIPHLETCARIVTQDHMRFPEAGRLLDKTGCILRDGARFAESLSFLGQALAITEAARGPDHPDTAISLNNLAIALAAQGKYDEAEPLYTRLCRSARRRSALTIPTPR
ncbi:MAG TPA: tetratricopeptide repeat protein, partial [Isosphaeraceae bacterium]|nr:tetratricopeptide repeat protein [Isosphaeraceae bacterium]